MRPLLIAFFMTLSISAQAAEWREEQEPGYDKSVVVRNRSGVFGLTCVRHKDYDDWTYILSLFNSGRCGSSTTVTIAIDGVSRAYGFECGGRDRGVLLTLTPDSKEALNAMSDISYRIRKAKAKEMSVTTSVTSATMTFSLVGAREKLDQINKACAR